MAHVTFKADVKAVIDGVNKEGELAEKAIRRTIGDMRSRGPGWVSKAVREEYNVSSADVKAAARAENDGSVTFGNATIDNVTLVYKGRVLTPTHFKMKPTSRPASGKPYQVSAEIKKGNRKVLSGKAFLAKSGGEGTKQIPFQREGSDRLPIKAIKTISVPQMIEDGDGNLKEGIDKIINENLQKRFEHYTKQYLG